MTNSKKLFLTFKKQLQFISSTNFIKNKNRTQNLITERVIRNLYIILSLLVIIIVTIFSPLCIALLYSKLSCLSILGIQLEDYLNFSSNMLPSAIAVVISAFALINSRKNESILLESSIDVIRTYLEIFYERFFEKSKIKYYNIKAESFDTHLQRLVKNHILSINDKVVCDQLRKFTRNFTSQQEIDINKEKKQASILRQTIPNLQTIVEGMLENLK